MSAKFVFAVLKGMEEAAARGVKGDELEARCDSRTSKLSAVRHFVPHLQKVIAGLLSKYQLQARVPQLPVVWAALARCNAP